MALSTKFEEEFTHRAREEGEKIFNGGNIELDDSEPEWASFTAAPAYTTYLGREKGAVKYACECEQYLRAGAPCKHVWAALLLADRRGLTEQWETNRVLDFLPEDEELFTDERGDATDVLAVPGGSGHAAQALARLQRMRSGRKAHRSAAAWKQTLSQLREAMKVKEQAVAASTWPAGRELLYVVDVERTLEGGGLVIEVDQRERKKDGNWGKPKRQAIRFEEIAGLPEPQDREIMSLLMGAKSARDSYSSYYYSSYDYGGSTSMFRLGEGMQRPLLERMCQTGRCTIRVEDGLEPTPIVWDGAGPWELWVVARKDDVKERFVLSGELRRGEQRMALTEPAMLVAGGLVFTSSSVAPLDEGGAFPWVATLREEEELEIPAKDREELLQQMLSLPRVPRLDLPEDLRVEEIRMTPQPRLTLRKPGKSYYNNERLMGDLAFDYGGLIIPDDEPSRGIYQPELKRVILRDQDFERDAAARMRALGFRRPQGYGSQQASYELTPNNLPMVIRTLTAQSWYIEADGKLYRQPGQMKVEVTSGIDWFELHGTADFGGQSVKLPELLSALRRGEKMVRLDDGTFGVLPEQWLAKYGLLADMGTATEGHIRFGRAQVGVLDALLASQPDATCDAVFELARERLRNFTGVTAAQAPEHFVGTLRPYQEEGLGWMQFLRDFSFGGCLADDMGLGKTVQVLALLESRRQMREEAANGNGKIVENSESADNRPHPNPLPFDKLSAGPFDGAQGRPQGEGAIQAGDALNDVVKGPSLVVAPRSLIFNWREEAGKFAPKLRVLDHTGIGRAKSPEAFKDYDLILTTYGTLRNDAVFLKDVPFDYVVIDEAQAIKNAQSEAAKATRLLHGRHRLALSGTPVQNHLGELWSLFEFLNPGMLGTSRAFQATAGSARVVEEQTRQMLSRALRPFILRRTKQQVAKDLPQRVEQTIHCELDVEQRKLYTELKEHYRVSLLSRIATEGIKKAKIQILEALLRLRQAACHPGLIDKSKVSMGSAKLDALLPQIAEVMDEGHKVLVFSQFTSFLAIVRQRLDKDQIRYAYLDGRTKDRQSVVDRFQNDPDCKLFLISLKAGGLGLNLTAAEYVFLLDPWWNPAVEAQAIDRAHRIGQTRQVFAYRLIAKDTVEEKVLQLQQTKRDLADAIIGADNSLIGKLGREDLELLLS